MKAKRIRIIEKNEIIDKKNVLLFVVQIRHWFLKNKWTDARDYFCSYEVEHEFYISEGPKPFNTIKKAIDYKNKLINTLILPGDIVLP